MKRFLFPVCVIAFLFIGRQKSHIDRLNADVKAYKGNTEVLLGEIEHYRIDSTRSATVIQGLQLSMSEYERYRQSDLETIRKLKLKIKDIEAVSNSQLHVYANIVANLQDTLFYRDSLLVEAKRVAMNDGYLKFDGFVEKDTLKADFNLDVNLHQVFYTTYKWKFLWWKGPVKNIRQVVVTDNPYVTLKYAEYIKLRK